MLLVEKSVWTFQIVLKFLTILTLLIFSTPSAGVDESYIAAATAGFHGYPLAQQEFLASPTGLLSKLELVSAYPGLRPRITVCLGWPTLPTEA